MSWSVRDLEAERKRDQAKRESNKLTPLPAPRCQCEKPFVVEDEDRIHCVICGKRP